MKKLKLSAVATAILLTSTVHAAEFNHVLIGGSENDRTELVGDILIATKDGNFVGCARTTTSSTNMTDLFAFKVTPNGTTLWKKPFLQGERVFWEIWTANCRGLVEDTQGNIIVTGQTSSLGNPYRHAMYVAKLSEGGDKQWERTYSAANQDLDFSASIINTSDGGFLLGGGSTLGDGFIDIRLTKIDALGNELWTKFAIRSPYETTVSGIVAVSDGFILTGYDGLWGSQEAAKGLVAKVSQAGDLVWKQNVSGPFKWVQGVQSDYAKSNRLFDNVVVGDVVYSTGYLLNSAGNGEIALTAHKIADGSLLYAKTYGEGWGANIELNPATGTLFIVGNRNNDGLVLQVSLAEGKLLSSDVYGGSGTDILAGIAFLPNGDYVLAGYTNSPEYGAQKIDVLLLFPKKPNPQTCSEIKDSKNGPMILGAKFEWTENGYILAEGNQGLINIRGDASGGNWSINRDAIGQFDVDAIIIKGATGSFVYDFSTQAVGRGKFSKDDLPLNNGGQAPDISNVQFCEDSVVTYGDENVSFITIWRQNVNGNPAEYVDTVPVETFDAQFQEERDYRIVDGPGEYLLEGLDDAGNTTSKVNVVRIQ
jgi:hypothetical protein